MGDPSKGRLIKRFAPLWGVSSSKAPHVNDDAALLEGYILAREDRVEHARRLGGLVASMVDALGGVDATNRLFFERLERGEDEPDYRDLFTDIIRGRRLPRSKTAFLIGDFFRDHFPWCSGILTLYLAGHLDAYVVVLWQIAEVDKRYDLALNLLQNVPLAGRMCEIDSLPMKSAEGHVTTVGAEMCWAPERYDDHSRLALLLGELNPRYRAEIARRQAARQSCRLSDPCNTRLVGYYLQWDADGKTPPAAHVRFRLAFDTARMSHLHHITRCRFIEEQLLTLLEEHKLAMYGDAVLTKDEDLQWYRAFEDVERATETNDAERTS